MSRQFQQLINDVEELLARLEDEHSPQLDDLHRRLETAVAKAKSTLHKRVRSAGFTSGILVGGLLGFLLASIRSSD
ncbi:MAG TPA: DUF883 family protein [Steroidobacteraceae bacterium]|jgi:ElaB/YqjD/DUF883 family membrane-anchored ribosome-binding protein|nr:DUF883 family protein [Steroidobacteraceae bacterium]